jgi:transposase-like protein
VTEYEARRFHHFSSVASGGRPDIRRPNNLSPFKRWRSGPCLPLCPPGRHFDREIIVLCARRYLRYKLSFRDIVEMMVERGLSLAHTTIMRWTQRYVPAFEKRWNRCARPVGRSGRVDETYVKIKGR